MAFQLSRRKFIACFALGISALAAPIFWRSRRAFADSSEPRKDRPNFDDSGLLFFTPDEYLLVYDVAEIMIPGEEDRGPGASDIQLANRLDRFLGTKVDPSLKEGLHLFFENFASGSELIKGRPFSELSPGDQEDYLKFWQEFPSMSLIRGGFLLFKRLLSAIYFSTEDGWDYINYGGPLNVYADPFQPRS